LSESVHLISIQLKRRLASILTDANDPDFDPIYSVGLLLDPRFNTILLLPQYASLKTIAEAELVEICSSKRQGCQIVILSIILIVKISVCTYFYEQVQPNSDQVVRGEKSMDDDLLDQLLRSQQHRKENPESVDPVSNEIKL